MRELHASTLASLDGFHEADGAYSFADGYQDSEWVKYANEMFRNYDTLVSGRVTYELYRQYQQSDEAAPSDETMSAQQVVVFSNTLTDEEVSGAIRYRDDLIGNVQALKEQPGKDILCIGSRSVRSQLLNAGLIDRMKIWYVPIALGSGSSVFEGLDKAVKFKLMRSYTFHNGLIRLEYDVLKPES